MGCDGIMKYFYVLHSESFVAFEWVEMYKYFSANVYTSPNSGGVCFFSRPPVWAASAGSLRSLATASLEVAQDPKRLTTEYGLVHYVTAPIDGLSRHLDFVFSIRLARVARPQATRGYWAYFLVPWKGSIIIASADDLAMPSDLIQPAKAGSGTAVPFPRVARRRATRG